MDLKKLLKIILANYKETSIIKNDLLKIYYIYIRER